MKMCPFSASEAFNKLSFLFYSFASSYSSFIWLAVSFSSKADDTLNHFSALAAPFSYFSYRNISPLPTSFITSIPNAVQ